ncbi:MAG: cytochrome P450 [Pseudomonadota bacterium]
MPDTSFPINAVAAVTHAAPYSYYARLRGDRPLFFDEGLALWIATSAAVVTQALAHPHLRVRPPTEPVPKALLGTSTGEVFARLVRMNDGAFHRQHRPMVAASAQRWSDSEIAAAAQAAAMDLQPRMDANDLLMVLPVQAMARLLGVDAGALDETTANVLAFTQGIAGGANAAAIARSDAAVQALMHQGKSQGLDDVRAANRIALMQQSVDATAALLGNSVLATRTHPAEWSAADPVDFVAECARWDPPVHNTRRFAEEDIELNGMAIRQGQGVLVVLASANRDPALNPEPHRFDVNRSQRRSLGFGAGVHACPGEAMAIRIVAAALPVLLVEKNYFGDCTGYRPLPNARIPTFAGR